MRILTRLLLALLLSTHALAGGRELAPPPLIDADPVVSPPFVAEAGGRFLTVWFEDRGFLVDTPLMGALTDGRGVRLTLPFFISAFKTFSSSAFEVVGTGDSFAIFKTNESRDTVMIDVALDGRVLGTRTLELEPHLGMRVAWNGTRFIAVYSRPGTSVNGVAMFSRDGKGLASGIALAGTVREIVATPQSFLVLAHHENELLAYTVGTHTIVSTKSLGPSPLFVRAAPLANGNVLIVASAPDDWRSLRARVWSNGSVSAEKQLHTAAEMILPLPIVPGTDRHLVPFMVRESGHSALFTMSVGNDGAPRSGVTKSTIQAREDTFDSAANAAGLFLGYLAPARNEGVFGVGVGHDGTVHAPTVLTIQPADQYPPALATDGSTIIGVWTETTGSGTRIRSATLGPDLERESDREVLSGSALAAPDLAWNGSEYLAVAQTSSGMYAARIAADGAAAAGPLAHITNDTPEHVALAWAGDRWIVVWSSGSTVRFATVSSSGTTSVPEEIRFDFPVRGLTLAYDGTHLHLTWVEARPLEGWGSVGTHIFTTRMSLTGELHDARPLAIPTWQPQFISSAANGEALLVLVDEAGRTTVNVVDPARRVSTRTLYDWRAQSDITWDGHTFVTAVRAQAAQWYVSVFRLGADGRPAAIPRGTTILGPQHSGRPSVAVTPFEAVIGLQEIDAATSPRAVVYSDREMPALPDAPPPPRNARFVPGNGGFHDLVWDDTAELYLVERRDAEGRVFTVHLGSANRLPDAHGTLRIRAFQAGVPSASTGWLNAKPRRPIVRR